MGRVKLVGVGLRRFFPRSAPSIYIYILIYLFKLSYIYIFIYLFIKKPRTGLNWANAVQNGFCLDLPTFFRFLYSQVLSSRRYFWVENYTHIWKQTLKHLPYKKIIPTRDPKWCCKELEEEIWGYHVRFCKFLCGDLCRRSCARSPWQVLCGSCCARSLCKAICTRCL